MAIKELKDLAKKKKFEVSEYRDGDFWVVELLKKKKIVAIVRFHSKWLGRMAAFNRLKSLK